MKLGMQSGSAFGTAAVSSGPAILPTHPNQPLAKLVVKSELGQVVQQWLILQNKSTLGSASSCALRCQLPVSRPTTLCWSLVHAKFSFVRSRRKCLAMV